MATLSQLKKLRLFAILLHAARATLQFVILLLLIRQFAILLQLKL